MNETVEAPVKSKYLSKTNITGALLAIFGLLVALGYLPEETATEGFVGTIVAAGGALVIAFRTFTRHILR